MITPRVMNSMTHIKNSRYRQHLNKQVGIQCLFPSFYSTLDLHINSLSFLRPLYFEGVNGYSIINRKGKHWGNLFKPQGNRGIYNDHPSKHHTKHWEKFEHATRRLGSLKITYDS